VLDSRARCVPDFLFFPRPSFSFWSFLWQMLCRLEPFQGYFRVFIADHTFLGRGKAGFGPDFSLGGLSFFGWPPPDVFDHALSYHMMTPFTCLTSESLPPCSLLPVEHFPSRPPISLMPYPWVTTIHPQRGRQYRICFSPPPPRPSLPFFLDIRACVPVGLFNFC